MARVAFNIAIIGTGHTLEKAWADAVKRFIREPILIPEDEDCNVSCDDCSDFALNNSIDNLVDGQLCKKCHGEYETDGHETG